MTGRPCIIFGNWKMHKTIEEAKHFIQQFLESWKENEVEIVGLAVPYTLIYPCSLEVNHRPLLIGAQNMNDASQGAFTGEIAASMIKDAGASFVLLGHSERRLIYGEDNAFINRKLKKALDTGLRPVLCVGETYQQREEGLTHEVLKVQLSEGLAEIETDKLQHLIIAYEPVWAIGHGRSASAEIVQEAHHYCREVLASLLGDDLAQGIVIQYGGSVNPSNAQDLLAHPDVDGLLVGGSSLSLETFLQIVNRPPAEKESSSLSPEQ